MNWTLRIAQPTQGVCRRDTGSVTRRWARLARTHQDSELTMPNYVRFERKDGSQGAGQVDGETIRVIEEPFWESATATGERLALDAVRLLPPCQPRSIVCVGLNYSSHLQGRPVPDPPTLFFKPLSSIAGPGDDIILPTDSGRVDPEGEIVIV